MRIAIYARVSTTDQNCEMQLTELRDYISRRKDWQLVAEYVDAGVSAMKTSRPELNRCMADARARRFDLVLVWKLDRWARSTRHLLDTVFELKGHGVAWMSYTQNLDTSDASPTGQLLLAILGAIAEFEREMIQDRVNSGIASYARDFKRGAVGKDGRKSRSKMNLAVGRPKKVFRRAEARQLRKQGMSWRAIAAALDVPQATLRLALRKK